MPENKTLTSKTITPSKPATPSTRRLIFNCLWPTLSNSSDKQRVLLDDMLSGLFEQHRLPETDRRWMTHYAYTLCRYWFALDKQVKDFSDFPVAKIDAKTLLLIKMGLLELSSLIATPEHAAVFETMELSKTLKCPEKARQFIHAVLQARVRAEGSQKADLPVTTVFPKWFKTHFETRLGQPASDDILNTFLNPRTGTSIRINTLKIATDTFKAALKAEEILFESLDTKHPEALYLPKVSLVQSIPGYKDGLFSPQNISAMHVGWVANPKAGERILEIGAAPGGKTSHLAALAQNKCIITALDISEKRIQHLESNLRRLGVENVETVQLNITTDSPSRLKTISENHHPPYDTIIIDAPCSATGVMRQHPDILLQLTRQDAAQNAKRQRALLKQAWPLLKPGGKLIYATCSIDPVENEDVIAAFVGSHPKDKTLISSEHFRLSLSHPQQDGFFIAHIQKAH